MSERPLIVGLTPFERPDARAAAAYCRAGALGVLDTGHDPSAARRSLAQLDAAVPCEYGVRLHGETIDIELPLRARWIVAEQHLLRRRRFGDGHRLAAIVTSAEQACEALAQGVEVLVAKGSEAGGDVGDEPSFVLLQRIASLREARFWAWGGLGIHTSAAAWLAGARGIVLDAQAALLPEFDLPKPVRELLHGFDGTGTEIVNGRRGLAAPQQKALAQLGPDWAKLPIGQDASYAPHLVERYGSVAELCRGIELAICAHIRQARATQPLARAARLAQAHGTALPIVQGPMTRVSDRPAFAAAVAEAGGLPMLALALASAEQTQELLDETRVALGGRPWGAGLLGFAPRPLFEAQLAEIARNPPPFALVAGGHPPQVRRLQELGVTTYLHAPSPTLLSTFIRDGLRHFVLEGRECGGHVGPRTSFTLWEITVESLLAHEDLDSLHLLFAGGVHDQLSAAMVSAIVAPLAARGARVGVLVGTAYLFTRECVESGAITEEFQRAAMECGSTTLLHTGPGHSIRAIASEYTRTFEAERLRLLESDLPRDEVWRTLETLNLGRLRLAAKGIAHTASGQRRVEPAEQKREGLYMIGQVAALRHEPIGLACLHSALSDGAERILRETEPVFVEDARTDDDLAIVGMACMFPDAGDLEEYWRNILSQRDCIREVSNERWNSAVYCAESAVPRVASSSGGFVPGALFEPEEFGIPPRALASIDPAQLLSLIVAKAALVDARLFEHNPYRDRTSVIFGASTGADLPNAFRFRALYPGWVGPLPEALERALPNFTEDYFPGNLANVIAGRISNRLDLHGVNFTVDAACASSLAAIDIARKELLSRSSDLVVVGAADLHNSVDDYISFTSVQALSPRGRCRPFAADADGIVLGEGVAAIVLKRRQDAERDGDRIYAIVKGSGGSSDGRCLGLTAPRLEGQRRALRRAYDRAHVDPARLGLIEAHGTGTVLGDRTELSCLTDFLFEAGAACNAVTLGSAKSGIGHTKAAAGMAGLIKAALAIHRGLLPPTRSLDAPNPAYKVDRSPLVFRDHVAPWCSERRFAGVSAMGFGGTNFHVVLANADGHVPKPATSSWDFELLLFRGSDRKHSEQTMRRVIDLIDESPPPRLKWLAAGACLANVAEPVQVAVVASSCNDLRESLARYLAGDTAGRRIFTRCDPPSGKLAFLFPGQGSQRLHMLSGLLGPFPGLQQRLAPEEELCGTLFPARAFDDERRRAQELALRSTRYAQPALGLTSLALAALLRDFGVNADLTGGHSYGELSALCYAGALPESSLARLSTARAEAMLETLAARGDSDPGTMAAVSASAAEVCALLAEHRRVVVANRNSVRQCVIAGPTSAVSDALAALAQAKVAVTALNVACAFHSPLLEGAADRFAIALSRTELAPPRIDVWSNVTAQPHTQDPGAIARGLQRQLESPVRFDEQLRSMHEAGARVFVEVGPGSVLTRFVEQELADLPYVAIATDRGDAHALEALLSALARLAVSGVDVDPRAILQARGLAAGFDGIEAERPSSAAWIVDGHRARPLNGPPPAHGLMPVEQPVGPSVVTSPDRSTEAAVLQYLHNVRDLVGSQHKVMLSFLGQPDAGPAQAVQPLHQDGAIAAQAPAVVASAAKQAAAYPDVISCLIDVLSERTGYPQDMLGVDLDLEADLGVDSIKRTEVLSVVAERLGLARASDELGEALGELKTVRAIAQFFERRGGQARAIDPGPGAPPKPLEASAPDAVSPAPLQRLVLQTTAVEPARPNGLLLKDQRIAISRDRHGVAEALAAKLAQQGAAALIVDLDRGIDPVPRRFDGWFHLAPFDASASTIRSTFELGQRAIAEEPHFIVAATGLGGCFEGATHDRGPEGGTAGFFKSLARELPASRIRTVDLSRDDDPELLAQRLLDEARTEDARLEVGYAGPQRYALEPTPLELDRTQRSLELGPRSVVVLTGGGRGITGQVAVGLARRFGCRLALIGRSPAPEQPEPSATYGCRDAAEVRRVLASDADLRALGIAEIERRCDAIMKQREVRATLGAIRRAGGEGRYFSGDVRDRDQLGEAIAAVYAQWDRIDGVIHGAGLIEDGWLRTKEYASFDRVYATKVAGCQALLSALRDDVRFIAFFSSITSVLGNAGQTDYAAANDYLDKLARSQHCGPARRLSVNWGPWEEAGMVSAELARRYRAAGIAMIPAAAGVEAFIGELLHGSERQILLAACGLETFADRDD